MQDKANQVAREEELLRYLPKDGLGKWAELVEEMKENLMEIHAVTETKMRGELIL